MMIINLTGILIASRTSSDRGAVIMKVLTSSLLLEGGVEGMEL